jgi:hypothetical protein
MDGERSRAVVVWICAAGIVERDQDFSRVKAVTHLLFTTGGLRVFTWVPGHRRMNSGLAQMIVS